MEGRALSQTFHWVLLCALCKEGVCFFLFVDAKTFFCLRLCMYTVWVGGCAYACVCVYMCVCEREGWQPPSSHFSFIFCDLYSVTDITWCKKQVYTEERRNVSLLSNAQRGRETMLKTAKCIIRYLEGRTERRDVAAASDIEIQGTKRYRVEGDIKQSNDTGWGGS